VIRVNFVSLLFYLGLVSIADTLKGGPLLVFRIALLKFDVWYLRDAFNDVDIFRLVMSGGLPT
jgi:hypothetical protein